MALWEDICKLGEASGRVRLRETIEQLESIDAAIAAGVADKLNGAKGAEFEANPTHAHTQQKGGEANSQRLDHSSHAQSDPTSGSRNWCTAT